MISKSFIIALLAIIIKVSISSAQTPECDPTTACSDAAANPGDKVIDPTDCQKYYVCITDGDGKTVPSTLPVSCPSGKYFDPSVTDCANETTPCTSSCVQRNCKHACDLTSVFIPYPNDCSKYYICIPGNPPQEASCPVDTPYFNGAGCTADKYSCCDICTPYCTTAFTEVFDPYDCYSFYLCLEDNYIPTTDTHFTCPTGTQFDEVTPSCTNITTPLCESVCTNPVKLLRIY